MKVVASRCEEEEERNDEEKGECKGDYLRYIIHAEPILAVVSLKLV